MSELSRYLFLFGAVPFVVLGIAHALATPLTPRDTKGLSPRDPAYREGMTRETLLLTRQTTLWLAWVGFNLSHSLGAVLFGVVVLLVGRTEEAYRAGSSVFLPFACVVSALYLLIGVRYWFRTPIVGITIATLSFAAATAIRFAAVR